MLLTVDQIAQLGELPPGPRAVRHPRTGLPTVQLQYKDSVVGRYPTLRAAQAARDALLHDGHPGPFVIVH